MKEALQQIVDLLQPVAALADGTPFEHSEVIQRCVDASEIALEALAQQANHSEQHLDMVKAQPAQQDWKKLSPEEPPLVKWAKEQPAQQEPVATFWQHGETGRTRITMPGDITDCDARWFKAADLYTSPPPQSIWVGLTDEEIWKFWCSRPEVSEGEDDSMEAEFVTAVRAVLAAHGIKEKNT